jgi:hypothetical protein
LILKKSIVFNRIASEEIPKTLFAPSDRKKIGFLYFGLYIAVPWLKNPFRF